MNNSIQIQKENDILNKLVVVDNQIGCVKYIGVIKEIPNDNGFVF
jgi:hypothetical protein